jgi:S1-C subfamily serine protease
VTTPQEALQAIQAAVQSAAQTVGPATVGLRRGSGVVVAQDRVLTVAHALRHEDVTVTFHDGSTATGHVAGVDGDLDVAVLSVPTGDRAPVRWEPAAVPALGTPVIALAHPRAARKLRAAVGLPERDGLLVRAVVDGSPAAAAGLAQGDLLIAVGGAPLTSVDGLYAALGPEVLELTVLRGTEERAVAVHFSS